MPPRRKRLTTVSEVIDAIGVERAKALARAVAHTAPGTWRWRKRFPSASYVAFKAELDRLGFSAPHSLWGQIDP